MGTYLVRRLILIIPTVLLVTIVVFSLTRLIPGTVLDQLLSQLTYQVRDIDVAQLKAEMGLDVPAPVQYWRWLSNIVMHGDLGKSLSTQLPIASRIGPAIPVSLELGIMAIIISLFFSLPLGIYSGIRQDTIGDYLFRSIAILSIAIPSFWAATLIIVLPSIWFHWVPPLQYVAFIENPVENLSVFIIPAILLGMYLSGTTMRMTRTMILEVMRQDYIRTAWAKGLKERTVVLRHTLKNAFIPVITIIGLQLPIVVGGSVVIEQIFNLPGIGRLMLQALNDRDYTTAQSINLIVAIVVMCANLLIDLAYGWLDPRIHYK